MERAAASAGRFDSLADLAREQSDLGWFAAVSEPLTAAEKAEAIDYALALGFDRIVVAAVADWRAAEHVVRGTGFDAWWNAENILRLRMLETATAAHGHHAVMTALTRVTESATAAVFGAASAAAARHGVADAALARVAAGAATEASYHWGLARIAGADGGHAFAAKYRLFAAGRWPLGIAGGMLHLF